MKILALNINQNAVSRGLESFLAGLKNEMVSRGMDFQILDQKGFAPRAKKNNFFNKILARFYLDRYSFAVLFFSLGAAAQIIREKPDVLIPTNGGWQVLVARCLRFFYKFKIMIIGEAGMGHDEEFNLRHAAPNLFVALTHEQEAWAKKINPRIKIACIPNGVDLHAFAPDGEKIDLNLPKPIFLCVAAFDKYKNIDQTICAVSRLDGSLVILGVGQEKDRLSRLGKEKLQNRFLLQKVLHEDLPKWYRAAQVFTLVSGKQEAFGNVYVEAMACGAPVVATDDEKRHEIVGEAGLYVDPKNIDEYACVLSKAAACDWDGKPRLQAENFSWEKIGERYYSVLKNPV